MIKGLYFTARSMDSKFKNIDVVANNLANINTTGFKRQVPFLEILNESGKLSIKQVTDFKQGEVINTANPLDLAISGTGFFNVKGEDGIEQTRNGKFKLNDEGFLINEQGFRVQGQKGDINLLEYQLNDENTVTISKEGNIKVGKLDVDTLLISKKVNGNYMDRKTGLNFLADEETETVSPEEYSISQGYLEESNVNPVLEMETMIQKNKEYESAYKVMNYLDQSLKNANEIGKT